MKDSDHFKDMLQERRIEMGWVVLAENYPDYTEDREDGTRHFIKRIPEYENRWLRVIVNVKKRRRVTVFFDRRLRRPHESKS